MDPEKWGSIMDGKKRFFLLFGLSVLLNVLAIFLILGAFGVIGSVPKPVGIAGFAVCVVLASVACLFAVFGNRRG